MPKKLSHAEAVPGKKSGKVSPARSAAFHILLEIARSSSAHSDDLLRSAYVDSLSSQDRNLCTALTMGVLRWQMLLDQQIAPRLTHKSRLDEPVRVALRIAAFQLLFYDRIPAHAAISDSVELTKRAGHRFASGLVNAVLRKLSTESEAIRQNINSTSANPMWMQARWTSFFGDEACSAICAHNQQPPVTHLRLITPDAEAMLIKEGIALEQGSFLNVARRVVSGDAANSRTVRRGLARIQDEGSQLIAELIGAVQTPATRILDCCAAPGGKTAILVERNPSARVLACDISSTRLERMRSQFLMTPQLAQIECRVLDVLQLDQSEQFDAILCDVPCSGTGTLSRNPEIKLRLQPDDLNRQYERQVAILRASFRALATGGKLIYSTCSLEPEEGEYVIQAIIAEEPDIELLPVHAAVSKLVHDEIVSSKGAALLLDKCISDKFLRTIPGIVPVDGFFAAIFSRK